jgi:hypothetical protein
MLGLRMKPSEAKAARAAPKRTVVLVLIAFAAASYPATNRQSQHAPSGLSVLAERVPQMPQPDLQRLALWAAEFSLLQHLPAHGAFGMQQTWLVEITPKSSGGLGNSTNTTGVS